MGHVVIIGNGVAGVTAARNIRKRSDHRITIVSSESQYFFSRPALMYLFMGSMEFDHLKPYEDGFWKRNRIDLVFGHAAGIDTASRRVMIDGGNAIDYDHCIVATGSVPNYGGWAGERSQGVQGLYSLQDLQNLDVSSRSTERAVVVGGGLIGIEAAEMLRSRNIGVTLLARESGYWGNVLPSEESAVIGRHVGDHGVDLRLSTELGEILSDTSGRVRAVVTKDGHEIACRTVVLAIGVSPNTALARASGLDVDRGIVVDGWFATTAPDVYAIGDCAQHADGSVDQLWYTARDHGEHVARVICGDGSPYRRDVFYNSAKFFDIEYQTYGIVPAQVGNDASFTWMHPDHRHFLRIVHDGQGVTGFNALGIRLRASACMEWIRNRTPLSRVLDRLDEADFDPEFTRMIKRVGRERRAA